MKDNIKWLLLIPGLIVIIGLAYLVPKVAGIGGGNTPTQQIDPGVQQQMNDAQNRINTYQSQTKTNPADVTAAKNLGEAYVDLAGMQSQDNQSINDADRNFKNAIDQFRKYLAVNPGDVDVTIDLGYAYSQLGMAEVALREFQAATAAAPKNQRAWLNIGYLYLQTGRADQSKAPLQKAINLDPNSDSGKEAKKFLDQANSGATPGLTPVSP